jgi:hypothetical protein
VKPPGVIWDVSEQDDASENGRRANLILIEQSGAKREIPQPSPGNGMIEAEQAIHRPDLHLREVKVVSQHKAIAVRFIRRRWRPGH